MNFCKKILFTIFFIPLLLVTVSKSDAGLVKWFEKEFIPTVTGERPLNVKPEVIFTHKGNRFELGENRAKIVIGGVTIQTHQLKRRLLQAGCTVETGGNIAVCAPDVIEREINDFVKSEAEDLQNKVLQDMQKANIATLQRYEKSKNTEWHNLEPKEFSKVVDSRMGWTLFEFKSAISSVTLIDKNWKSGNVEKYYESYSGTDLLIYVEGLGFSRLYSSIDLPSNISRVWLKINDDYIFDNTGTATVSFSTTAKEIWHQVNVENAPKIIESKSASWIGVKISNTSEDYLKSKNISEGHWVYVSNLYPNGPAARSGLKVDDFILAVNGIHINSSENLASQLKNLPVGSLARLKIWRSGQIINDLTITVGARVAR